MRPAAVIITLAALSATSAYQLELGDFWPKVGAVKFMESCLGTNVTRTNVKIVLKTLDECNHVSETDSEQTIESLKTADWDQIFSEFSPSFYNQEKFAPDKAARIARVTRRISPLVERFRCTMQRLALTDSNNVINLDTIVEAYKEMGLSQTLLADLLTGINQCHKLTICLPPDYMKDTPIPQDVVLVQAFLNCGRYMRNWACLKHYLSSYVAEGEYDFSGADGTLDFLPDDEARAAAVSLANELVGGDDYGLYE